MSCRVAICLLLAGCYDRTGMREALPSRFDAPGCHVSVLAGAPGDRSSVKVARVRIFADLRRIDERWALEVLAARACAYGANAIVLLDELEPPLPAMVPNLNADYVGLVADAFKLP